MDIHGTYHTEWNESEGERHRMAYLPLRQDGSGGREEIVLVVNVHWWRDGCSTTECLEPNYEKLCSGDAMKNE